MLAPNIKNLFFDTNAIIKLYHDEKGSDVTKWLCSEKAWWEHTLHLSTCKLVKKEFNTVIGKLVTRGELTKPGEANC